MKPKRVASAAALVAAVAVGIACTTKPGDNGRSSDDGFFADEGISSRAYSTEGSPEVIAQTEINPRSRLKIYSDDPRVEKLGLKIGAKEFEGESFEFQCDNPDAKNGLLKEDLDFDVTIKTTDDMTYKIDIGVNNKKGLCELY